VIYVRGHKKETINVKVPMVKTPIIREPFSKIAIDIVGPLSRTKKGNKYILTVIDEGTRYPEAFPLPSIEAERIAQSLVQLFSRVGVARVILSDQGSNFTSTLLKQLYEMLGVKGITTSPYRPQSNGKCERYNGTLKKVLKKLCITYEKDWDEMLPYALFAYRETPHEETGFSPFELLYGWPVRGPTEILKLAMTGEEDVEKSVIEHVINVRERLSEMRDIVGKNLTDKQSKMKAWYDRNTRKRHFSPGDEVLVLLPTESSKMTATWKGPFRIVRKLSDVNYQVNVGARRGLVTYHINLLKRYNRNRVMNIFVEDESVSDMLPDMTIPDDTETYRDVTIGTTLHKYQRQSLWTLCEEFSDILTSQPGRTDIIKHEIKTTSETPILLRPYRIPYARRDEVRKPLEQMLKDGHIVPSKSPWSSPIVPIDKHNGSIRLCVDYRKLNDITQSDGYQILRIDGIIQKLGDSNYLSRVDLSKGFWQCKLHEQSRAKSAFITLFGQYEFTVMPFGMKTAPSTFARFIDKVVEDLQNVVTYFDDLIIFSDTFDEHLNHLRNIFGR
jgi:hypothetical protein